ncbi:Cloroperoxidase [Sistotremastrum suecicum HHB10207 ss-3]|uniref:Cloroperoxidase n=1 Tax=Sistotremastrum suecicum HHB10207 ss-3 TaxID=1314776 RepID=A0A166D406_9AGAM|nr:Cloroperoxidase [Sistotremastrum suecicum HHB10207 ss-3]
MSNGTSNPSIPPFVPPGPTDSRSPCPALNVLANHNYIPHNGLDISPLQLIRALQTVYNASLPFSIFITLAGLWTAGYIKWTPWPKLRIRSLHALAAHNVIEHDASLVHENALPIHPSLKSTFSSYDSKSPYPPPSISTHQGKLFAPTSPSPSLLAALLSDCTTPHPTSPHPGLGMSDIKRARQRRDKAISPPSTKLDFIHEAFAWGESAKIMCVLGVGNFDDDDDNEGSGRVVSAERIKAWLGEERLPDDWTRPEPFGILKTNNVKGLIQKAA